jgi:hypothetical protein
MGLGKRFITFFANPGVASTDTQPFRRAATVDNVNVRFRALMSA